ncbi:MAG: RNA polymerase factor sigma-54 [Hydrogenophaga sp.]|jgi:RNA polymerase sigma-54 factor|uniref:RNA polymerase factor sigma-54 n=1 Tax=Hydrogenophaga sp. TaxID=1904254 RepID=UPI002631D62E|nr:RNA polymerase factor sigma-54 [Hydrogenophaga sp.]MCW5672288.1 RNA polymerase factor sigma-54 [Hydrogenophaga sp.]
MIQMDARTEQRQNQTLSPRLQHAVRLLQMSSLDFGIVVRDVLGRNPFLEAEEGSEDEALEDGRDDGMDDRQEDGEVYDGPRDTDEVTPAQAQAEMDADRDEASDSDVWLADGTAPERQAGDGNVSALDFMMEETPLNAHLHGQLGTMALGARDRALAGVVVESLDDDGYLRTPLSELCAVADVVPAATLEDMQIALKLVQSLEPAGVAARDVAECLSLQLGEIECPHVRAMARAIVNDHMDSLAARDVPAMARALDASVGEVEAVCDRIRHLDPRPGWRLSSSRVNYIVPDVIVRKDRGSWNVQLNAAVVPKVRLNEVYAQLFQRHRCAENAEMGAHLQEARWTLRNVEQRFSTILDVSQAIVRRQRHFFEYGSMAMKPLGLREIAEEVGIHESTVSRVTNNKYMATPTGVYELKHFFSRAMVSANGKACSGTAIRGLIQDIIESETSDRPLSDAEITRQLARQGLTVARRTVTKYRQMLRIEAVGRRKRHDGLAVSA